MPDKVIITGGAGFIGSHLCEHLKALGRQVLVIDNLSTGRLSNIQPLLDDRCRFIQGDAQRVLQDQPQVLRGVGQVYHLAAAVGVKLVVDDPVTMIRNNVEETAAVLEAAAAAGAAVLVTSSSEVYGKNPRLPMAETHDLLYGPTTSPRWSYGLSKALDEHLALAMAQTRGLGTIIVRLFNTIGPRQIGRYGMVVPRFVQRAVDQQDLEIYGDGSQTRAFCDVRDVVRAMVALLDDPACHGVIYNLGCDRQITINDLADLVIRLAASRSRKRYVPYEKAYHPGFEDPQQRVPDLTRIRHAIGFAPAFTLEQTLSELIRLAGQPASTPTPALERP